MLRSIARPLMARVKESTGILGLAVEPNARKILIDLYNRIVKAVDDSGDPCLWGAKERAQDDLFVCKKWYNLDLIEKKIRRGQVEELIEEAKGVLENITANKVEDDQPVPKHVITIHGIGDHPPRKRTQQGHI